MSNLLLKKKDDRTIEKDGKKKRNLNTVEHSIKKNNKKKTNLFGKIDSA